MNTPPVITVQLPKGGVGKTAVSVAVAEAAAEAVTDAGRVLLADADPQGSATRWHQLSEADGRPLRSHVVGLATRDLAARVPLMAAGYGFVVIDGPPGDLAIVRSAINFTAQQDQTDQHGRPRQRGLVLMPVPPRGGDFDRVPALVKMCADAGARVVAVQTFARANSASALAMRDALGEHGVTVAQTTLPTSEPISRLYGQRPKGKLAAFGRDLLMELLEHRLDMDGGPAQ